jgi:hypothetical protein
MKKCNKVIVVMASLGLIATHPVFAESPQAKQVTERQSQVNSPEMQQNIDRAVQQAKELLPYLTDFHYKTIRFLEKKDGPMVGIRVTLKKYENKDKPSMTLDLDKDGSLTGFYFSEEIPPTAKSAIDQKKVKELATAFLKKWYGEEMRGYELDENYSRANWAVFSKKVNGLFYPSLNISIGVNGDGQIVSSGKMSIVGGRYVNEPPVETTRFPDPNETISIAEVEKSFDSYMRLYYIKQPIVGEDPVTKKNRYGAPVLHYKPVFSELIDAKTGKEFPVPGGGWQLTQSVIEVKPDGKIPSIKTVEDAAAFFSSVFDIDTPSDQISTSLSEDKNTKSYVYGSGETKATVLTDEKTGEVKSFTLGDRDKEKGVNAKFSPEEAQKVAINTLEKYLPVETKEVVVLGGNEWNENQEESIYYFKFANTHQGVPILDETFYLEVDRERGKVVKMIRPDSKRLTLPDPNKVVSAKVAAEEYLKHHPLQLQYYYPENGNNQAVLVYKTAFPYEEQEIDAITGKLVDQ